MNFVLYIFIWLLSLNSWAQKKDTYTYNIKGTDTLKLDVYTPENIKITDTLPVILWMHGGGFSGSHRAYPDDKKFMEYVATEQNYIGVSIDYRQLRKNKPTGFGCDCTKDEKLMTFRESVRDYMDAAKYIVEHSKSLQIDASKIIVGGSSAGAEGILNTVYMREYFLDNAETYDQVSFAGVFSCAGALVDASYLTPENRVPSVLFHGTKDQQVPFDNAPHHYCDKTKDGYLMLDGPNVIAKKLEQFETSFYFNIVKEGEHEISAIPFKGLDKIFAFFEGTILKDEVIQTRLIKTRK